MSAVQSESLKTPSINQQFWRYVLPTVSAMLVSGLYQVIDGIFIGRYIGADGLAGINVAWPVIGALYGMGMMIGVGSGAISSMSRGEKDYESARLALGNGLSLLLILGIVASLILSLVGDTALAIQRTSGDALNHARDYLQVMVIAAPLAMGSMALPFMVRNDEAPSKATMLIVVGAIMNVFLDALFVAWFGWGLKGAALATSLSQALVVILGIGHFISPKAHTQLTLAMLKPIMGIYSHICSIGLSSLLMYAYFSFILAIHNYLFMEYGGTKFVGAFAIVGYISALYFMFAEGVASGTQPLISYHYGASELPLMKQFVHRMFGVAVSSGIIAILAINLFADPIIDVFNSTDATLSAITKLGLRLHLLGMFLDGFIFSAGVFFQSLGLGRKATFVTIANMIVQFPFLYFLPRVMGVNGVWLAVPASNLTLSFFIIWMLWREWQKLVATPVTETGMEQYAA